MDERADCGKMADMCGRSTPLAGNADDTSILYIYLYGHPSVKGQDESENLERALWSNSIEFNHILTYQGEIVYGTSE